MLITTRFEITHGRRRFVTIGSLYQILSILGGAITIGARCVIIIIIIIIISVIITAMIIIIILNTSISIRIVIIIRVHFL